MTEEGYIKFDCRWQEEDLPEHKSVDELNLWRGKLYNQGLIGAYPNGIGFGNLSVRTEANTFMITGTATGNLPDLTIKHYTLVTNYNINLNHVACKGPIIASSESLTHAILYELDPDIEAIVHIHNKKLWEQLKNVAPTTSAKVAYGTPAMAKEVKRLFNTTNLVKEKVLVMGGHQDGLLSFGKSLAEAANKFLSLV